MLDPTFMKMADLIHVPLPAALVNPTCEVFVHAFASQATVDTWLELRKTGQSIFNTMVSQVVIVCHRTVCAVAWTWDTST